MRLVLMVRHRLSLYYPGCHTGHAPPASAPPSKTDRIPDLTYHEKVYFVDGCENSWNQIHKLTLKPLVMGQEGSGHVGVPEEMTNNHQGHRSQPCVAFLQDWCKLQDGMVNCHGWWGGWVESVAGTCEGLTARTRHQKTKVTGKSRVETATDVEPNAQRNKYSKT